MASDSDERSLENMDLGDLQGQDQANIKAHLLQISRKFSGPLPPPEVLSEYGHIVPDAPERILTLAEKQANHRIYLEKSVIEAGIQRSSLGLKLGFIIGFVMVVGGIILLAMGRDISGYAVIAIPLAGIVGTFIYSNREQKSELEKRRGGRD